MRLDQARPELVDEALVGFEDLMHSPFPGPLVALYEAAGSSIISADRLQATWHPTTSLTVRFRVQGAGGGLAGRRDVVAMLGRSPQGAIQVECEDTSVAMWIVPDDPFLPGLRSALDRPTVGRLLSDLGFPGEVSSCRIRAYRPGRRALVHVDAGNDSVFLKIVRPCEVDVLHERHRYLADILPVPDSLGIARKVGIVAMPALTGADLRSVLRSGSQQIPDADAITGLLRDLPLPPTEWTAISPLDGVTRFVDLLGRLLPGNGDRLEQLAGAIGSPGPEAPAPVHGDFHEAQVLVRSGRPIGLVDLDTFGWGHPADDAATMLGHLHLLAAGSETPGSAIRLARDLNGLWDRVHDPVDLRRRVAAVVLGLATGPFRVQSPDWPMETMARIEVAEQWVNSARRLDERDLIPISAASHT